MLALYRCGRQAEALDAFTAYRTLLEDELGMEPSSSLREQQAAILRQSSELDGRPPPPEELHEGGSVLPIGDRTPSAVSGPAAIDETTSFMGGVDDIVGAAAALSEARLLTLTGVGGVGKTRLAARVAIAVSDRFADGVSWCELAPLTDPAAVAPALATSLGVRRQPDAGVVDSIADFLAQAVATGAGQLRARPRGGPAARRGDPARVPAGGGAGDEREGWRSRVSGSSQLAGCPFRTPNVCWTRRPRRLPCSSTGPGPCVLTSISARSTWRRSWTCVGTSTGCHSPSSSPPPGSDHSTLSTWPPGWRRASTSSRPADADAGRHSTLRAVLDWSYNLLTPTQRRLFDRLSVFSGSFDLAAAEAVGSGDGIGRGQLVDLLASLVDASMISVGATNGRVRYSLLETLRGYGAEHLGAGGEADAVRLRHARHYASIAEQADRGLRGPDEAEWVTTVDRELGNLRAAHQWSVQSAQLELALRLSCGLHYYMLFRYRDEVVSWGQVTLDLRGADQHPLFAEVCGAVGEGLTARGQMDLAASLADRALANVGETDEVQRMYGLRLSGMISLYVGRLNDGFRDHAEMLRLARLHDHPYEAGMALLGLAQSRTYAGAPAEGLAFAEEQYRVVQPLGNPSMLALAWYDQAEALSILEPEGAIEPYQRAIGLAESAGATFVEGIALVGLASLLGRSGDPGTALPLFRAIVERWRQMGVWTHQWTTLRNLVQLLVRIDSWEIRRRPVGGSQRPRRRRSGFRSRCRTHAPGHRAARGKARALEVVGGRPSGFHDVRPRDRHLRVRGHR